MTKAQKRQIDPTYSVEKIDENATAEAMRESSRAGQASTPAPTSLLSSGNASAATRCKILPFKAGYSSTITEPGWVASMHVPWHGEPRTLAAIHTHSPMISLPAIPKIIYQILNLAVPCVGDHMRNILLVTASKIASATPKTSG